MKTYSFKKRLFQIFLLLFTVTVTAMVLYFSYFTYTSQKRTYKDIQQLLSLYNEQTSDNLKSVDYFLMELTNYSQDVSSVALQEDIRNSYSSLIKISQLFEFNIRSFPIIRGMYTYFPKSDTWVSYTETLEYTNAFDPYLKEQFKTGEILENVKHVNGLEWIPLEYEGNTYLIKAFTYANSVVGAWTDLKTLSSSLTTLSDMNAMVLFTDEKGNIINIEGTSSEASKTVRDLASNNIEFTIPVSESIDSSSVIKLFGQRYLVTTAKLDYCDYYVSVMIPMNEIIQESQTLWHYSGIFILLVCSIFGMIIYMFFRLTSHTVQMMSTMSEAIVAGDSEKRIDISSERCEEVIGVAKSYNSMVDSLQKIKVDVYEERIQKKNFQLLFLRSQIAPHFLINCLNMISYLADGTKENTKVLRQMIGTLSKHLRYTLSTDDNVPLSRELEYLENYIDLNKVRFPGCLTYEMDFDQAAMDAQVFPLILIMFTENTFKFNLVMGEPLTIKVSTKIYDDNGTKRLHITHLDSGDGYSQDVLDYFEGKRENMETNHERAQVGMNNIVRRLELFFGDSASIKFSNEPGWGAKIDIDIPYVAYDSFGKTGNNNSESIIS